MSRSIETLVLFDVDGTLSTARQEAKPEMKELLQKLRDQVCIGIVSGSDLSKVSEQLGSNCLNEFDFVFPENGLVAYENGQLKEKQNIAEHIGEAKLQKFINFCLEYMSKLDLPVKRGTFIEFRNGLINICPPGRSVSQEQRDQFGAFDQENQVRAKFVQVLQEKFGEKSEDNLGLYFAIGGRISIDAFPHGWDKPFCLKYVQDKFKEIHFYGDRTAEGGNDFHIYEDARTIGHAVKNPQDTYNQLKATFNL